MRRTVPSHLALTAAALLAGLGTIKLYVPAFSLWVLIGAALLVATWPKRKDIGKALANLNYRIYLPWIVFVVAIAAAAIFNDLPVGDRLFSLGTILKFIVIAAAMALLICMRLTRQHLEDVLTGVMILAALGFAVAILNDDWLMRYGDGRLAWTLAWAGVFWKVGIFALPFFVWRAMVSPSWPELPRLSLALLIVALDGSRTGFLAAITVVVVATFIAMIFVRSFSWARGLGLCALSAIVCYLWLQPTIAFLIAQGGAGRWISAFAMVSLATSVVLSRTEFGAYGSRGIRHYKSLMLALGLGLLIATLLAAVSFVGANVLLEGEPGKSIAYSANDTTEGLTVVAVDRLTRQDETRLQMLSKGWEGAVAHFPIGGGLGTTKSNDNGTQVHIHMTYLQLLSDVGVVGLLSYLAIFGSILLWFLRLDRLSRLYAVPVMAIPGIYLLQGMFTPLSNEMTEWFPVILAASVMYGLAHGLTKADGVT